VQQDRIFRVIEEAYPAMLLCSVAGVAATLQSSIVI